MDPARFERLPARRGLRVGIPAHALLQRLSAIEIPTFVANGDLLILPRATHTCSPG